MRVVCHFSLNLFFLTIIGCLLLSANAWATLPVGFVYLRDIDSSILQDIRYASSHNFVGRPIKGYNAAKCILTKPTALALAKVQATLKLQVLTLKVYDCYRPQTAVNDFLQWSADPTQQQMKAEFYPRENKADLFKLGYIAKNSGHSRGSTVDLTIVPLPTPAEEIYDPNKKLVACYASYAERFHDNSIDMGTGYDCLDKTGNYINSKLDKTAQQNRKLLRDVMMRYGFNPYAKEWWHFTLKNEPFPNSYFDFPVQ